MKKNKSNLDEDLVLSTIQVLSAKTKADPNPEDLEALKKLIRKNVPFTLRSYFSAYLLREILEANTPNKRNGTKQQSRKATPKRQDAQQSRATRDLPEGARTLYLNVGKMKRLYPKELSQILQDKLSIERDEIYSIRIHDKYSFVSMSEENCERAIAELNGLDIRGRTLSIAYSNRE